MTNFTGIDALQAIMAYLINHGSELPAHQRDHLTTEMTGGDLLRRMIVANEVLYASRENLSPDGIDLMDGLSRFISTNNFYGMGGFEGRATKIALVAQRMLSEGEAVEEGDVEPSSEYAAPEPSQGAQ